MSHTLLVMIKSHTDLPSCHLMHLFASVQPQTSDRSAHTQHLQVDQLTENHLVSVMRAAFLSKAVTQS